MDEVILRLKGVSALLIVISEVDENTVIANLDMGVKLINNELLDCVRELEDQGSSIDDLGACHEVKDRFIGHILV